MESLRQEAWVGDAVLELYARRWVLQETNQRDADRKVRFVRNSFLSLLGQPTRVEAEIGRRYREEGLDAAFDWIAEHFHDLFARQEANRGKAAAPRSRKPPQRR